MIVERGSLLKNCDAIPPKRPDKTVMLEANSMRPAMTPVAIVTAADRLELMDVDTAADWHHIVSDYLVKLVVSAQE